jgi:antitoxin component YwqK of YwqJK toxin-antitoxin module
MLLLALLTGLVPNAIAVQEAASERETVRETYADGSRRSEGEALRDADGSLVLDGKFTSYHPDGSRESVGRHRRGVRHGSWRFLYPGGDPERAEGSYKNGWRDGAWKAWTPDGKFDESEAGTYRTLRSKHPGGALLAEGETLDGVPHGRWLLSWESGAPMASGELRCGRMHGPWLFWHEDGSLDRQWIGGHYEDGWRVRDLSPSEPPQGAEPDPSRLPPLPPPGDLPVGVVEAAQAALQRVRTALATSATPGKELDGDLALLRGLGRSIDAQALAELCTMDLGDPLGATLARRWESVVLCSLTGGAGFGLSAGVSSEDQAANRRSVLRWRSVLCLARLDDFFLEFEVAHPPRVLSAASPEEVNRSLASEYLSQCSPALPIPGLDTETARAAMHPLFAPRLPGRRAPAEAWGKPGTQALDQALQWLCDHQASDGRWAGAGFNAHNGLGRTCACDGPGVADIYDVGLTGLALLALMADGSSARHGRHAEPVRRGLSWLISRQDPGGLVGSEHGPGYIYNHAIATQALCEALGMSASPVLRRAAKSAVDVCLRARNPYSAWRYELVADGKNDTSITAWMVAALKAGQDAGLAVDTSALQGALSWIDEVTDPDTGRCGYDAMGTTSARVPGVNEDFPVEQTEALTAAALLCRQLTGADATHPMLAKHADLLRRALPEWDPGRCVDMYYWYYGSQAMARRGGQDWLVWSKALADAVVATQRKDGDFAGSWDPIDPWSYAGGRIYATALLALSLEAPLRYPPAPVAAR